jgi:hypothetical protein
LLGKISSQYLHWMIMVAVFSDLLGPHTFFMCFRKCDSRPNVCSQYSHLNGLLCSCRVRTCIVRVESCRNAVPQLEKRQEYIMKWCKSKKWKLCAPTPVRNSPKNALHSLSLNLSCKYSRGAGKAAVVLSVFSVRTLHSVVSSGRATGPNPCPRQGLEDLR